MNDSYQLHRDRILARVRSGKGRKPKPKPELGLRLVAEENEELLRRREAGESYAVIAEALGFARSTAHYRISVLFPELVQEKRERRGPMSDEEKRVAIERRKAGLTLKAISIELGVCESSLCRFFKKKEGAR